MSRHCSTRFQLVSWLAVVALTMGVGRAATTVAALEPSDEEQAAQEKVDEPQQESGEDDEADVAEKVDKPTEEAKEDRTAARKKGRQAADRKKARAERRASKEDAEDEKSGGDEKKSDAAKSGDAKSDEKKDEKKSDEPKLSVTHHTATIAGKKIAYTATAGKMVMKTDEGDPKAHVFFIAYTKDSKKKHNAEGSRDAEAERDDDDDDDANDEDADEDADDDKHAADSHRPVTFCFNGGPGSSSVWLHLGMLGPTRVKIDSDAGTLPPPHELVPNEYSLLDVSDLVFIDPVSTGFSRPVKGEDKKQFHGYDEDLRSVAQFIHDYTTKYGRWASPKFLIGESYGGLRAAGLSGELQNRYRIYLNGIVLISAVVDFQTLMTWGNNDIAYVLFLPSYSATAWYHKALSDELQDQPVEKVVAAAEQFAAGPYLRALAAGDAMSKERRQEVVKRMAELTGLSEEYIEAANLRVSMGRFGKELLRSKQRVVGRFDSRYVGISLEPLRETAEYDPSSSAVFGTFASALNDYLRQTLKVDEDRVYEILTDQVYPWDYSEFTNQFVDASTTLRYAMTLNPNMKVFAACGYYDLATPSFAMEHTRDHLNLSPEIRKNFSVGYYEAGHMMYVHEPSLVKLRKDLSKFYKAALEPAVKADADDSADE